MIKWTDMTFTGTDVVKLVGFIGGLFTLYFNIVIEIHDIKNDYRNINQDVTEVRQVVDNCCGSALTGRVAIRPDEPRVPRIARRR